MPTAAEIQEQDKTEEWEMIIAGYRACAAEVIRFLTEEESVPADSPLVLGLWQHMMSQECHLDIDNLISGSSAEDDSGLNLSVDCVMPTATIPVTDASNNTDAFTLNESVVSNMLSHPSLNLNALTNTVDSDKFPRSPVSSESQNLTVSNFATNSVACIDTEVELIVPKSSCDLETELSIPGSTTSKYSL